MKKLLSYAFIGLLSLTVFSSCKKDPSFSRSEPTIAYFNAAGVQFNQDTLKLTLYSDSSMSLNYKVNTDGTLKWLYKTADGVRTLISDGLGKSSYEKTEAIILPLKDNIIDFVIRATNTEKGINKKRLTIVTKKYVPPVAVLPMLTGTVIGTPGSWSGGTNDTRSAVFDGNTSTFFDATVATGAWAGLDLGSSKPITRVRYMCRSGDGVGRMNGGRFQGASDADFTTDVTTLHTITEVPTPNTWISVTFSPVLPFRYVRYIGGNNSYGNIAEVEFY